MNVTIAFPPLSTSLSTPPASLAALKALRVPHIDGAVSVKDLNVLLFHDVARFWPARVEAFRLRFESMLLDKELVQNERTRIAKLLYFDIPHLSEVLSRAALKRLPLSEAEVKILYPLLSTHFLGGLLTDGSFLFADRSALSSAVASLMRDPLLIDLVERNLTTRQDVFGLSLLAESQLPFALAIAGLVKAADGAVRTIAGGPYITEMVKAGAELDDLFTAFDFIVPFEGESALASIMEAACRGGIPDHSSIISHGGRFQGVSQTEPIDSLRTLDFSDLDLSLYTNADLSLPVYSSKGCPWARCAFCSIRPNHYRERCVDLVIADLRATMSETRISHFQFVDEDVTPARLRVIADALRAARLGVRWFIQARLDRQFDYDVLSAMRESGCYAIEFGLESGSPAALRRIRKGITLETVRRVLHLCEQLGYRVVLNCMVGFPDETYDEACETANFIDEVSRAWPRLKFTCNTQLVKIYKTTDYAKRTDLDTEANDYSVILKWNGPAWLPAFLAAYKHHRLFQSAQPSEIGTTGEAARSLHPNPTVALQESWLYHRSIPFDFGRGLADDAGKPYLQSCSPRGEIHIYALNASMSSLVEGIAVAGRSLSELRRRYSDGCAGYPAEDVKQAFESGILSLHDLGALEFS